VQQWQVNNLSGRDKGGECAALKLNTGRVYRHILTSIIPNVNHSQNFLKHVLYTGGGLQGQMIHTFLLYEAYGIIIFIYIYIYIYIYTYIKYVKIVL